MATVASGAKPKTYRQRGNLGASTPFQHRRTREILKAPTCGDGRDDASGLPPDPASRPGHQAAPGLGLASRGTRGDTGRERGSRIRGRDCRGGRPRAAPPIGGATAGGTPVGDHWFDHGGPEPAREPPPGGTGTTRAPTASTAEARYPRLTTAGPITGPLQRHNPRSCHGLVRVERPVVGDVVIGERRRDRARAGERHPRSRRSR